MGSFSEASDIGLDEDLFKITIQYKVKENINKPVQLTFNELIFILAKKHQQLTHKPLSEQLEQILAIHQRITM